MKILWLGLEPFLLIDGHKICIMNKDTFRMETVKMYDPDIIIDREFNDGRHIWDKEVDELKRWKPEIKTAVWLIDTHVGYYRHKEYIKHFDYVFMAISKFAQEFKNYHPSVHWLPLCFPAQTLPSNEKNVYPIGFVGRVTPEMERRVELLNTLKNHYQGGFHCVTDYNTVYKTMSQCTIMVNQSFADDLNFRVFEALACGNILVTNSVPDLHKIDTLDGRVYTFESPTGAISLIDAILMEDKTAEAYRMVEENRRFIKEKHMIDNRIYRMLEVIGGEDEQTDTY